MTPKSELDIATADIANATKTFHEKVKNTTGETSQARVAQLASEIFSAVHNVIHEHQVSYAEYDAVKAWLIKVGEDGEWPLFLDVFVEHAVEDVATAQRPGSKGSILGPFYVPDAPRAEGRITLPMRADEPGTPLVFRSQVRSAEGTPLPGAQVDVWQSDSDGLYSHFAPGIPEWNLRGIVTADAEGRIEISTMEPAPYQIPHEGATGQLIVAAGWHAWRPAHLHFLVVAEGHETLTSQLYFAGGPYTDEDVASAVKPELMLNPTPVADGSGNEVEYDFVLAPVDYPRA
ncbi:catechol 1,2-dioxygenase [Amycolatopsis rhabdoformis]|uniref:Catechol 1,2-dioxygenase n=1 Tax=Amycolatopsis rhabdoformis TaxID=1448059 RepID=A0ABZ1IIE7_9PSEU|nr:catechol 1,2-dioxygenase [Amycolatopsis rhabdoformis]WSE34190.1 catechol 1,2-dioxygenase [Amycolatopsis rhabdoformis]